MVPGQIYDKAKDRMKRTIDAFDSELGKVRTGRANAGFLDSVSIDYYGNPTPLSQVASISVLDSRTLSVSPWDRTMLPVIEKAIRDGGLGLNPSAMGEMVRVPMPPLTEERRKDLVKLVKSTAEGARVAIRNVRRDANAELKEATKSKQISEDEEHLKQDAIQKLTDQYTTSIDKLLQKKEEELMTL